MDKIEIRCQCPYGNGGVYSEYGPDCAHPKGSCDEHIQVAPAQNDASYVNMCSTCYYNYCPEAE